MDFSNDVQSKSPIELFEELYFKQNNRNMSEVQKNLAIELIEEIKEGKA